MKMKKRNKTTLNHNEDPTKNSLMLTLDGEKQLSFGRSEANLSSKKTEEQESLLKMRRNSSLLAEAN